LKSVAPSSEGQADGDLGLSALAAKGLAYPDGVVGTDDLLYTRLVPKADVSAELGFSLPDDATSRGTGASTWRCGRARADAEDVQRNAFLDRRHVAATHDAGPVRRTADPAGPGGRRDRVDSGQLHILITAVLELVIDDDGQVSEEEAASVLSFTADWSKVELDADSPLIQAAALPLGDTPDARSLNLVGVSLPPGPTRTGALAVAAFGALALGASSAGRRFEDEDAAIRRTAGELLVPADPACDPKQVVDVASFAALLGLAQRYDRMVLYADSEGLRFYFVLDDGIAYRYYSEEQAGRLDAERATTVRERASPAPEPAAPPPIPRPREAADEGALV
jgi:hypothetical protein